MDIFVLMEIQIKVPTLDEIFKRGIPLPVVTEGWYRDCLGDYAYKSGVYIHHAQQSILYVGQTTKGGDWGNFAERLRRECHLKASQNSPLYQLLFQNVEYAKTTLYPFDEIELMFSGSIKEKMSIERMALILEQFMIAVYNPIGNKK
jgi:hypothetical protein